MTEVKMVCETCGGMNVKADAYAAWDIDAQSWVLEATFDKGSYCEDCDDETRILEQPVAAVA